MTGKIIDLMERMETIGDGAVCVPDDVLLGAIDADLAELVLVGLDGNGEIYIASTHGAPRTVWALERAKIEILVDGGEGE